MLNKFKKNSRLLLLSKEIDLLKSDDIKWLKKWKFVIIKQLDRFIEIRWYKMIKKMVVWYY